jgi:hypothetical protein
MRLSPNHCASQWPQQYKCQSHKTATLRLAIVLMFICTISSQLDGAVILNEVLANEPGSNVVLEWIELYNTGSDTVSLEDCLFLESNDSTVFVDTLILPPLSFAVLSRRPTASDGGTSFESHWGDNSGVWGDDPNEDFLLLAAKFSLKNSDDCVWLLHSESGTADSVCWDESAPDGVSLERVNPFKPPDPDNLAWSRDVTGSTPGRINSMIPPDFDLGLMEDSSGVEVLDDLGVIYLHSYVQNCGLQPTDTSGVTVFFDRDFSGDPSAGDESLRVSVPALMPDSCFLFDLECEEPPGRKRLILELPPDGDSLNNRIQFDFAVGAMFVELLISEFLVNPTVGLGTEWLELVNGVDYTIDLLGFALSNLNETALIDSSVRISPGQRLLLCENRDSFESYYGSAQCTILEPNSWVDFSDSSGTIVVLNDFGRYSDALGYDGCWPDNISWERCEDSIGASRIEMFHRCTDILGSTPCDPNGPPPELAVHDLAFTVESINVRIPSESGQAVDVKVEVCNVGSAVAPEVPIDTYLDIGFDGVPSVAEYIGSFAFGSLATKECQVCQMSLVLPAGHHRLILTLPEDEDTQNNRISVDFSVGPETHEIVITEFLADPEGLLESEWVECRNHSKHAVSLAGWTFGDDLHPHALPASIQLEQGEYLIIAEDSGAFVSFYGEPCRIVEPLGWSNLNNTGDCIRLIDTFGVIADSVVYTNINGDNRSLELNEHFDDNDCDGRWYPSTAASLSSPCQPNSVSGAEFSVIEVSLVKQVFSPSLGESLEYRLQVPPATMLTIEIFDLAGRKQFTIADDQPFSSGNYNYAGDSDYRSFLPVGAYVMKITSDGGSGYATKVVFAVAGSR